MSGKRQSYFVYKAVRNGLWLFSKFYFRFTIHGKEHVPHTGGCVVASNHGSFLDPPLIASGSWHRVVRYMPRDTLYVNRFAKWLFTQLHCIPLDRTRGDIGALRKAIQVLKGGDVVGLFPEGTRTPDGEVQEAKGGIGFLIAKSGVPVVPAYIYGTFDAFPKGARFMRPHKIRLIYGPPISPEELTASMKDRSDYQSVGDLVMQRIIALKPAK